MSYFDTINNLSANIKEREDHLKAVALQGAEETVNTVKEKISKHLEALSNGSSILGAVSAGAHMSRKIYLRRQKAKAEKSQQAESENAEPSTNESSSSNQPKNPSEDPAKPAGEEGADVKPSTEAPKPEGQGDPDPDPASDTAPAPATDTAPAPATDTAPAPATDTAPAPAPAEATLEDDPEGFINNLMDRASAGAAKARSLTSQPSVNAEASTDEPPTQPDADPNKAPSSDSADPNKAPSNDPNAQPSTDPNNTGTSDNIDPAKSGDDPAKSAGDNSGDLAGESEGLDSDAIEAGAKAFMKPVATTVEKTVGSTISDLLPEVSTVADAIPIVGEGISVVMGLVDLFEGIFSKPPKVEDVLAQANQGIASSGIDPQALKQTSLAM